MFPLKENSDFNITPEDVTIEILSKLPVKSLIRLRCVCKLWYALISNTNFISKHFKHYSDENTYLIIEYEIIVDYGRDRTLSLFLDKTLSNFTYQDLHMPKPGTLFGPLNGIFCICTNNRITLWNMAMREYRKLPKCNVILPRHVKLEYLHIGFGLDLLRSDYKLLFIRSFWDEKGMFLSDCSHFSVYTLSTNVWRILKDNEWIPYRLNDSESTYLNGVCYWLAYRGHDSHNIILSFHMGDEEFQEIEKPCIPQQAWETLGSCNNSLTLLLMDWDYNFEISVMEESCNWIKKLTFGPILGVLFPRGFWKNDGIFIESNNGKLLLYNPSSQELRNLGHFIRGAAVAGIFVHSYKESLVRVADENLWDFNDIPWHILGVHQIDTDSN